MPVSANVFAWRAAICAAMAIWGVTCVPEARRAATLRAGFVAAAAAAAAAAIGAVTASKMHRSVQVFNNLDSNYGDFETWHNNHFSPAAISCCCCCFSNISFSFCSCSFFALSSLEKKRLKKLSWFKKKNTNLIENRFEGKWAAPCTIDVIRGNNTDQNPAKENGHETCCLTSWPEPLVHP